MSRQTAIGLMVLVAGLGALVVWLGSVWVELYTDQISELLDGNPDKARIRIIRDFELIAVATGAIMWLLAAFLLWYGLKGLRTQSMPPRDSWVIEGQRIWTGTDAVFHAKIVLVTSAIFWLLGIVAAVILWRVPVALLASQ